MTNSRKTCRTYGIIVPPCHKPYYTRLVVSRPPLLPRRGALCFLPLRVSFVPGDADVPWMRIGMALPDGIRLCNCFRADPIKIGCRMDEPARIRERRTAQHDNLLTGFFNLRTKRDHRHLHKTPLDPRLPTSVRT